MKHKINFLTRMLIGSIAVVDTPVTGRLHSSVHCASSTVNRVVVLLFALLLCVGQMWGGTRTIYCKMEHQWWRNESAAVGVHLWGSSSKGDTTWPGIRMTPVSGTDNIIWQADVDDSYKNCAFVRVNPSGDINDWGARTSDLTIPTDGKNMFTISNSENCWRGGDCQCNGSWSTYTPTFKGGEVFYMDQNMIATDGSPHDFLKYGRCDFNIYNPDNHDEFWGGLTGTLIPNTTIIKFVVTSDFANKKWGWVKVKALENTTTKHETAKVAIPTDGTNYIKADGSTSTTLSWGTYTEPTPYTGKLYIVGGNCLDLGGWGNPNATEITNQGNGIYTYTGEIKAVSSGSDDGFKFLKQNNSWQPQLRPQRENTNVLVYNSDGSYAERLTPDVSNVVVKEYNDGTTDTKWQVTKTGTYTITVDLSDQNNAKMSITSSTPTPTAYYIKHKWNGDNEWTWKQLTDNGDGTYSIIDYYGDDGCNWNTKADDDGKRWIEKANLSLVGSPTTGDECTFTLNPTAGTITITKNGTPTPSESTTIYVLSKHGSAGTSSSCYVNIRAFDTNNFTMINPSSSYNNNDDGTPNYHMVKLGDITISGKQYYLYKSEFTGKAKLRVFARSTNDGKYQSDKKLLGALFGDNTSSYTTTSYYFDECKEWDAGNVDRDAEVKESPYAPLSASAGTTTFAQGTLDLTSIITTSGTLKNSGAELEYYVDDVLVGSPSQWSPKPGTHAVKVDYKGSIDETTAPVTLTIALDNDYYIFGDGGTDWITGWSTQKWKDEYKLTTIGCVASKTFYNVKGDCLFKIWKKSNDSQLKFDAVDNSKGNITLTLDGTENIKIPLGNVRYDVTVYTDGTNVWVRGDAHQTVTGDYFLKGKFHDEIRNISESWSNEWSTSHYSYIPHVDDYTQTYTVRIKHTTESETNDFKIFQNDWSNGLTFDNVDQASCVNYTKTTDGDSRITVNPEKESDVTFTLWKDKNGTKWISVKVVEVTVSQKTVTFHSNGGTEVAAQQVSEGGTASKPTNPTKNGNTFQNWYSNSDCTGDAFNFSTPITTDIDLYAKWTPSGNIKFVSSLGKKDDGGTIKWDANKGINFTNNNDVYTVTYMAPKGRNHFEAWADGSDSKKVPQEIDPNSPVTIRQENGHMYFDLTKIQQVTITYNGKFSVSAQDYTPTFEDAWYLTTGSSWGGKILRPDGSQVDMNGDWKKAVVEDNGNNKLYNVGGVNALIVLGVPSGNKEFKLIRVNTDDCCPGKDVFNALYVDTSNPPSGLTWHNGHDSDFGTDVPHNEETANWRNIQFSLSKQMDLIVKFDGGTITITEAPPTYRVTGAGISGSDWDLNTHTMEEVSTGIYCYTESNMAAGKYVEFKVTKNSSWDGSLGYSDVEKANVKGVQLSEVSGSNNNIKFNVPNYTSDVKFYTNGTKVWVEVVPKGTEALSGNWYVMGYDEDWNPTNPSNQMTITDGVASKTYKHNMGYFDFKVYGNSTEHGWSYYSQDKSSGVTCTEVQQTISNIKIPALQQANDITISYDGVNVFVTATSSVSHTVKFYALGQNFQTDNVWDGETATEPQASVPDGYTFLGWYDNASFTGDQFNFSTPITEDKNIYAKLLKHVTSISISATKNTLDVGETLQLSVNYTPADAEWDKSVSWSSDNTQFLTVDENGLVTAKAQTDGIDIRATTPNGKTATYQIKVNAPACTTWMVSYWNDNPGNKYSGTQCFTQVGTSNEWRADFTLKTYSANDKFWVGNGGWSAHSAEWDSKGLYFHGLIGTQCSNYYPGQDVVGQLVIYDDSQDENYAVRFDPIYAFTYGIDGQTWNWHEFHRTEGNNLETELVQVPSNFSNSYNCYVGLKKSDNTVMFHNDKSEKFQMDQMTGLKDAGRAGQYGKYHIFDNSCDRNWYVSFTPYYTYELRNDNDEIIYVAPGCPTNADSKSTTIYNENLPTKTGYTQIAWSRSIGGTRELDLGAAYNYWKSPDIFYPVWQANTYTVTLMNGDQKVRDVTATYNAAMPAMGDIPTKTGYTFAGFYTEQGGQGTQYYNGTGASTHVYDTDGDMTLYAHWTINQYNVSWVTDGDALTGDYTRGSVNFGTTIVAPNTPTKTGYTFAAWTPTVDATVPDHDVTYTATWNMIAITGVTLDKTSVTLKPAGTQQLTATVLPAGVINTVTWESSDIAVATVDNNGLVTAVDEGTAIITCEASNAQGSMTAICTVTVDACSYAYSSIYTNTIAGITTTTVAGSVGGTGSVANLYQPTGEAKLTAVQIQIPRGGNELLYDVDNNTDHIKLGSGTTDYYYWFQINAGKTSADKIDMYYLKNVATGKYLCMNATPQTTGGWGWYYTETEEKTADNDTRCKWYFATSKSNPRLINYASAIGGGKSTYQNGEKFLHKHPNSTCGASGDYVSCGSSDGDQGGDYLKTNFINSKQFDNPDYIASPVNTSYYRFNTGATMTSSVTGGLKESDKIIVYCYNPGSTAVTGTLTIGSDDPLIITVPAGAFTYEYLVQADANSSVVVASNSTDFCVSYVEVQRNLPTEYITPTITWSPTPVSAMTVGQTYTSVATATGKGTITYTSSNELVATVAADGTVTPLSNGSVTITATAAAHDCYNSAYDSYTATVTGGLEPPTITFTTLPTDAPQGSVQTVVVTTTGGANFNLELVGEPDATLEFVSNTGTVITAKVKVGANASDITLRATTEEDSEFAATTKNATLTVSACIPTGADIFTFTLTGSDAATGQVAGGLFGGTVDQTALGTKGTEDNPATVDVRKLKFYTIDSYGFANDNNGSVEAVKNSNGSGAQYEWLMIPANETVASGWAQGNALYYLYNASTHKYLCRGTDKYNGGNDWESYNTVTTENNAKTSTYKWFFVADGSDARIYSAEGLGSEGKNSFKLETCNLHHPDLNNTIHDPKVVCGHTSDLNAHTKIYSIAANTTVNGAANPIMIKSVEYNEKTYYIISSEGSITLHGDFKAGDTVKVDTYNRQTKTAAIEKIKLTEDASSYTYETSNEYVCVNNIKVFRAQVGEMVTPTLTWGADLTKPVMLANGASITYVATSNVETINTITYTSSNTEVATVEEDGTVTMKETPASAPTTITATLQGVGCYNTATCTYVVIPTTNIFNNAAETKLWSNPANWSSNVLPDAETDVIIQAKAIVDINTAAAKSVVIDDNGQNAEIEILSQGGLQVEGTITRTTDGKAYSPTTIHDLYIHSDATGTGALVFNNSNEDQAYVEMYSKANIVDKTKNWQYMGTPFSDVTNVANNYYGSYLYFWNTAEQKWKTVKNGTSMSAFAGYCISQENKTTYVMSGTLVSTANKEIILGEGNNVIGNSWTAPINVNQFTDDDFKGDITKTIYMFNTGVDATKTYNEGDAPGTYIAIPINMAGYVKELKVIPAMAGYFVVSNKETGTLTLNYDRLTRTTPLSNEPMRAPNRANREVKPDIMSIKVTGESFSDKLYLAEREDFAEEFDNGWDAEKWPNDAYAPELYASTTAGDQAVSALPELEGTLLGFRAGDENAYTISFQYDGDKTYYLNDLIEQKSTLIRDDQTYFFLVGGNDLVHRFQISTTPFESYIGTGSDNIGNGVQKAVKFIENDKLFILRNGRLYDGTGKALKPGK